MTERLLRVLEKPENSLSTSLFAFSFSNRPIFENSPVGPAEHVNRVELVREWGVLARLGKLKRMNCGWGGFEMTE